MELIFGLCLRLGCLLLMTIHLSTTAMINIPFDNCNSVVKVAANVLSSISLWLAIAVCLNV